MDVKFSSKRPLTPEEEAEIQQLIRIRSGAPEATDEALANARPFREVFPILQQALIENAQVEAEAVRLSKPRK